MSDASLSRAMGHQGRISPSTVTIIVVLLLATAAWLGAEGPAPWLGHYPKDRAIDLAAPLDRALRFVLRDMDLFGLRVADMTHGVSWLLAQPLDLLVGLLAKGFRFFRTDAPPVIVPPVPWPVISVLLVWGTTSLAGRRAGVWTALVLVDFGVCGLWEAAMTTLALLLVAVAGAIVIGLALGVLAYRDRRGEILLDLAYDVMQTLPVFSYLLPILFLFGFGPIAALAATIVAALPPMARVTTLALRQAPRSIGELAAVAGCTPWQTLWMAQLPTALRTIMLGVNQAVMFALSMAVVAALIGGEGLGANVLTALRALRIGDAVVAGAAITFMAIAIDQVLRGIAAGQGGRRRMPGGRAVLVALLLAAAGMFAAWMKPALAAWPEALSLHPGNAATELVQAINTNFEGPLTTLRTTLIVYILKPFQLFLLALPFSVAILATTLASFLVGGARLAARCALVLLAIAVTGWWDRAMISLHLVVVAAFAAALLGVPIGLLPGLWPRSYRAVCLFTDMLLTLPSFVYLIPAVMLFSVGDVPALFAIVAFAIAPIIRYTADGMVNAPAETIEAAEMIGASAMQRLVAVRLPLALPQMILGLSQTLLMCFAMLVITALVGTRGLEEITLNDLARIKLGEGLVAGLALSGLAIVLDRLVQAGSRALARRLGLARSGAPTVQEE